MHLLQALAQRLRRANDVHGRPGLHRRARPGGQGPARPGGPVRRAGATTGCRSTTTSPRRSWPSWSAPRGRRSTRRWPTSPPAAGCSIVGQSGAHPGHRTPRATRPLAHASGAGLQPDRRAGSSTGLGAGSRAGRGPTTRRPARATGPRRCRHGHDLAPGSVAPRPAPPGPGPAAPAGARGSSRASPTGSASTGPCPGSSSADRPARRPGRAAGPGCAGSRRGRRRRR